MRIVGVDPGLAATGLGVVEVAGSACRHVAHAVIRTRAATPIDQRLATIRDAVRDFAREHGAQCGSVEGGYVGSNAKSSLALGQARAAAILGLADAGLSVVEYAPRLVKQTVSGYGDSTKDQVAEMVRLQLQMPELPTPADAADALALAITHWARQRLP